ncbi:AAA family ATPase [Ponticoccus gilvus]|nr:AAA family ATPase [Enemella evansiae]
MSDLFFVVTGGPGAGKTSLITELSRRGFHTIYNLEGYDENGDAIVLENIGPFDDFENACKAVENDAMALSILRAQGVQRIGDREIIPW